MKFFYVSARKISKNDYCDYFRDVYCSTPVCIVQLLSKWTDLRVIYVELMCDVIEQMKTWPLTTGAVLHYKS
jgi:hypothetical protein